MNGVQDYIYLPPRATTVTLKEVQRRINAPYYLDFGVSALDARLIPPIPGDLVGIMGRPGHAKTTMKIALAKRWSKLLRSHQDASGRSPLVVYATWETSVEEFMAVYTTEHSKQSLESIGRRTADLIKIEDALVYSLSNNVVVIGQSNERESGSKSKMPNLGDLSDAITHLKNVGYEIGVLFVDYLQRIPHPKYTSLSDRTNRVSENTEMLKDIAVTQRLATVMGVQADRQVDKYEGLKLPTLADAQWASAIEQTSDKLWAITIPSKYLSIGKAMEINGWRYQVTPNTLAFASRKQRFGPHSESDVWLLDCNFAEAKLSEQTTIGEAEPYK